jgi:nucleoid-associated protein YgaU
MDSKSGLSAVGAVAAGAVVVVAVALGSLYVTGYLGAPPEPAPEEESAALAPAPAEPETGGGEDGAAPSPEEAGPDAPAPAATEQAPAEPSPPAFDIVRVEPDGEAQIAGRAAPGAEVTILLDEEPLARTRADADGRFFTFLSLGPSASPRLLTLSAASDGRAIVSEESVILAPGTDPAAPPATGEEVAAAPPRQDRPEPTPETGEATAPPATGPDAATELAAPPAPSAGEAADTDLARIAPAPEGEAPAAPPAAPAAPDGTAAARDAAAAERAEAPEAGAETPGAPGPETLALAPETAAPAPEESPPAADSDGPAPVSEPASEAPAEAAPAPTAAAEDPAQPAAPEARPAPETAPSVILAGRDGVRVIQRGAPSPAAPDRISTLALDAISYDAAGEVRLSGRAPAGAFLRIYIDNRPVAPPEAGPDGTWTSGLPGVSRGVYTLRLDALGGEGEVTSRIELPFQRESRESLAAAQAAAGEAAPGEASVRAITVQPGNTLWGISRRSYGRGVLYVRVYEANRGQIVDPDLIYPGQVLKLPQ